MLVVLFYGVLVVTLLAGVLIVLILGWPNTDVPGEQGERIGENIKQTATVYENQPEDNVIPFPLHRRRKNRS